MKTTKTITVDIDVWNTFLLKVDNCSGTINEMIKAYNNTPITINPNNILKEEIIKLQMEIAKRNQIIKDKDKEIVDSIPKRKFGETEY